MYQIKLNPTALHVLESHPIAATLIIAASIFGTRVIASIIVRGSRRNSTYCPRVKETETLRGANSLQALEDLTKHQKK